MHIHNNTLRRLLKNKSALLGMVIIILFILTAILAYILAADSTTNANRQVVEIGKKKPGYTQLFYIDNNTTSQTSLIHLLFNGNPNEGTYIPIVSYTLTNDSIILQKYVDALPSSNNSTLEYITERVAKAYKPNTKLSSIIVTKKYLLGTDAFGRDILSRILVGTRVSLSVGLIAVLISLTIGVLLGALAGYYKGWVDDVIMWLINVVWSIPTLLLVFAFTIALGKGFWQVFIAVGLTMWVQVARLVRGQVLKERTMQYVEAAKLLGYNTSRIILKHILPNIWGPIIVIAASNFASAIIIEAGLSFLGIGVQAPKPSWGLMIKENYNFILTHNPILALAPGIAIMMLVLAFYLLGNGLRDSLQVKGK